jgi:small-conductance mechanosensitive channel
VKAPRNDDDQLTAASIVIIGCTARTCQFRRGHWQTNQKAFQRMGHDGLMLSALETRLDHIFTWFGSSGLQIVLIVVGAILLTRFTTWFKTLIIQRIDDNDAESDALVRSEAAKHRHSLAQVLNWTVLVLVYCIAGVQVVARLGISTSSLVAPAAVLGVALGFGAQRLVQDLLAGFFIIAERQYGFGDLISIAGPGVPEGVIGTVEDVTLRVTKVRTANGEVVFTPNGQISQVTNLSRDWARVVVDVPVPLTVDIANISDILREVGRVAYSDEELGPQLLDEPAVMGVQSIEVDQIFVRIVARTLPGRQFLVGLALRGRIAAALRKEGIHVPVELDSVPETGAMS